MLTSHSCWKRRSVCSNSRQCFSHALSRGGGQLLCKMLKLKLIGAKRIKKVQFNRAPAIPVDPVCSTQQAQRMSPSTIFFFSRRSDINFNKCEPCNANPQKRNVPKLWMHLIYVPWQHSLSPYSTKVTWQAQAAWTVGAHRPDEASQLIALAQAKSEKSSCTWCHREKVWQARKLRKMLRFSLLRMHSQSDVGKIQQHHQDKVTCI